MTGRAARKRGPDGEPAKTLTFQGIEIAIDRPIGTAIGITLPDGTTKTLVYQDDYGFFPGVPGPDGGSLDVYVGSDAEAGTAFVVNQLRADTGQHDEFKVLVGYTFAWLARDAYLRHAAPEMFGGMGALSVSSLRAQVDAQRGQDRPAYIVVETLLEGAIPTAPSVADEPDVEPPSEPEPPSLPEPEPQSSRAPNRTTSPTMPHAQNRFRALAHALALITLAGGGVDDDTRAALEPLASDASAQERREPAPGPDALHVRSIHVREVRKETREVDYVASTETVDSYDEVLRQNWILDRYLRNPVILWAHNNDWAVPTLPIGRATKVRVEDKKLLITAKFSEANPFARIVFDMIVEGMLRAGSVGFRPHKVTRESIGGVERVVCDQNELYEFSICPIGSNPDALVDAEERMAKAIEAHAQRAMAGGAPAAPAPQQPARGERSGSVSVERAAEALRRLAAAGVITNSNPAPAGKRNKMKIKTLTKEQHDDLGRRGVISHECEGCKDILVLEAPGVVALAQEHRELSAKAQAADDRAKAAETARAEAETRAKSADDRAKAAETARDTAVAERDAATKRAGDEKARADKAISEKAAVELAPLTGIEPWQLSPAAAKRLAARAATDPDGYAADVAEVHDKGVKAGVLKSGNVPRVPETSKSDPTPAVSELDANAGDDRELLAEMEKRAKDYALLSAANATGVS